MLRWWLRCSRSGLAVGCVDKYSCDTRDGARKPVHWILFRRGKILFMNNNNSKDSADQPSGPSPTVNPSYQRDNPFVLTDQDHKAIAWAVAEIDREQIRILRTKTLPERIRMAASMIDAVEGVGVFRLRAREPELSEEEALRIVRGGLMNYARQKRKQP